MEKEATEFKKKKETQTGLNICRNARLDSHDIKERLKVLEQCAG